jgi:hypothetical protein
VVRSPVFTGEKSYYENFARISVRAAFAWIARMLIFNLRIHIPSPVAPPQSEKAHRPAFDDGENEAH